MVILRVSHTQQRKTLSTLAPALSRVAFVASVDLSELSALMDLRVLVVRWLVVAR